MIREVRKLKMHIFYDDTNTITLCRLGPKGTEHIHVINLFRSLFEIFIHGTFIYAAYTSGEVDYMQVHDMEDSSVAKQIKIA